MGTSKTDSRYWGFEIPRVKLQLLCKSTPMPKFEISRVLEISRVKLQSLTQVHTRERGVKLRYNGMFEISGARGSRSSPGGGTQVY